MGRPSHGSILRGASLYSRLGKSLSQDGAAANTRRLDSSGLRSQGTRMVGKATPSTCSDGNRSFYRSRAELG